MNSANCKGSALKLLAVLGMTFCLAGCLHLQTTQTAATDADIEIASGVCTVWLNTSYSSLDTEETQLQVRANNAARYAYCGEQR